MDGAKTEFKKEKEIKVCSTYSGRSIPDFIAVWDPFIFGTLRKPAEHPIIAPPGKTGYGIDWNSTSIIVVVAWQVIIYNRSL